MKVCCGRVKTIRGVLVFSLVAFFFNLVATVAQIWRFGILCTQYDLNCIAGGVSLGVGVLVLITVWILRRKLV